MPYNAETEERIGKVIAKWKGVDKKKMFGGICHLIQGNMFCGVYKDYLILRLGADEAKRALEMDNVKEFDITGRPMKGWVMVNQEGFADDKTLEAWLEKAKKFARSLPPK